MEDQEPNNPCKVSVLCKELNGIIDAHADNLPESLHDALKMTLHETCADLLKQSEDAAVLMVLGAIVEEMAFEITLHLNDTTADQFSNQLSTVVAKTLPSPRAVAA